MSTHEVFNNRQEIPTSTSPPTRPSNMEDMSVQAENTQPCAAASAPQLIQPTRTFFGLAQDSRNQSFSRPVFNDDYVARFPEDPYGQETAPNARAWRAYVEEATAFDENMVGQSRDGLDVMLVFAGLFSAVVTSFLVQVAQNLQADFSEMSALLLHDLLIVQLSMADGATVNLTTTSINPTEKFEPNAIDVWINGLWVVSLTTSLVVALSAVLVKQWLHRYMTFPSGTPGLRSHVRQFRFMGLEKWRVRIIIGMLPIVMHISLILFFVGLALFYIPLRASLAWAVGTITVIVCILYLVSNTIPILFPQCPYQTPLTDFIHHVCQVVPFGIRSIRHHCFVVYRRIRTVPLRKQSFTATDVFQHNLRSLSELESDAVQDAHTTLSVDALDWLYRMSSNPTVHTLVLQGISGLPADSRSYAVTKWSAATNMQNQRYRLICEVLQSLAFPGQPWVVERLCRSCLFLPIGNEVVAFRDMLFKKSGEWDPRIKAAISLTLGWSSYDYNTFFISHSEVLMHPLIWEEIVRPALSHYASPGEGNIAYDGYLFAQLLLAVIIPPLATTPSASLMTGPQVVWTRLQPQFWDMILETSLLVPYDSVPGALVSSYHRMLIAAGKLALSNVQQYTNDIDNFTIAQHQHLELLACVVKLITDPGAMPDTDYRIDNFDVEFLICVLEALRYVSFSIESETSSALSLCLDHIRSFYVRSSSMPEFHFPALDCFLQSWPSLYKCVYCHSVLSYDEPSDLKAPMNLLGDALSRGHEEAYRIFMGRGLMRIIFTEWARCGDKYGYLCRVIVGYIGGLYTMTSLSQRREFCQYLHEPQHLMLAFILIATGVRQWGFPPIPDLVVQLAKICPSHTSWGDCDTALKTILAWSRRPNPEISRFPWPLSLQSLDTAEAFREYPLVEWTARRFTARVTQGNLMIALEALDAVLENAEHVGGVLMPDLEGQTSNSTGEHHASAPG